MQQTDLTKIVKRLELIKNLIALEEDYEINRHVDKLDMLIPNDDLQEILNLLKQKFFTNALIAIDNFIISNQSFVIEDQQLIPYRKGDKWGFCTTDKKIVIDCKYEKVFPFIKGMASVRKDDKWGLVDKDGNKIFECIYDNELNFFEGLAAAKISDKMFFLDINGNVVIPFASNLHYGNFGMFNIGLAPICIDYKWGVINRSGCIIIPPLYDMIPVFSENTAIVLKNKKSGLIDIENKTILDFKYQRLFKVTEDILIADIQKQAFLIDYNGVSILDTTYDDIEYFGSKESLAKVRKYGKFGLIDFSKGGSIVIPIIYDNIENEGEMIKFEINNKYGLFDLEGRLIVNSIYELLESIDDLIIAKKSGKFGLIHKNGLEKLPFIYQGISSLSNGLLAAKLNNKWGVIDINGNAIIAFSYQEIGAFRNGLLVVKKDNRWGCVDENSNEVIRCIYERKFSLFKNDRDFIEVVFTSKSGTLKAGFISIDGIEYWEE